VKILDNSLEYRKMCYKADVIQDNWRIEEGDYFVLKASYCCECNENKLCDDCLEMDNLYVIS
jgi:hypothetical protein